MKKAFTLIELLVVIAIIAILAALLMPALDRARKQAIKASCAAQVHNVGLGMGMLIDDSDGIYPGWVTDLIDADWMQNNGWNKARGAVSTDGEPFYQLYNKGYLRDLDVFNCPASEDISWSSWTVAQLCEAGPDNKAYDNQGDNSYGCEKRLLHVEYAYDLARISRKSVSGRIIYGDAWERQHVWSAASGGYWPFNHSEGSNVLYVDNAVEFSEVENEEDDWEFDCGWTSWQRHGWIANPRMDEDRQRAAQYDSMGIGWTYSWQTPGNPDDLLYPRDHDDIYAIEGWNGWGGADSKGWGYIGDPVADSPVGTGGMGWSQTNDGNASIDPLGAWGNAWSQSDLDNAVARGDGRAYHFWNDAANRRHFPEVGPFARSGEWETHDARLLMFSGVEIPGN